MAMRSALLQLTDSVGVGILGLNRSCWGASTSGFSHEPVSLGLRLLSTLAGRVAISGLQLDQDTATCTWTHAGPSALRWLGTDGNLVFVRGYKSNKRSLKPLNTAASWQAIQPLVVEQQQRQELLGEPAAGLRRRRWQPRLAPIVDTCLPSIPRVSLPTEYKRMGVITGQYSLKPERTFAVVQLGGTQFKVTTDDIIFVNQLHGVNVNDVLALDRVMLLGSRAKTIVGRPYVPGATVLAAVEEHFRDGKVHVFKKKRRKRYTKYQAPRANLTTLRILQVRGILPAAGDELALVSELPIEPVRPQYAGLLPGAGEKQEEEQVEEQKQHVVGSAVGG